MPIGLSNAEKITVLKTQLDPESQAALTNQNNTSFKWEQPIPFDSVSIPQFPIDCLPSQLKDYVLAVSESTQTPVDMAAVAALATMAVCVQGKFKVQGKPDWIEPLNLYSTIVAKPAERKSRVLSLMTKYVDEYEYKENERLKPMIDKNRLEKKLLQKEVDKLIDSAAKDNKKKYLLMSKQDELTEFKEIKPLRLLADDASAEALTSLLAANSGKMAVISSEGGIFEILQGRYTQSVNIDTFLKAHCGDPIRIDRKGRESEYIKEPCLTVLLSIQPQVLEGLITNEVFRGRGLTARFLYSIPVSSLGSRKVETEAIPTEYKTQYRELCFDLLNIEHNESEDSKILHLSDEAYRLSVNFAEKLEPRLIDDLESIADFAGKLHGAVLRIAGILHIVKQLVFAENTPIPRETMQAAIQLGYYFLEHAKAAYQLMGADERMQGAKYILDKLEKQRLEKFTKNDLMRICRKFKRIDELNEPISMLIEFNYLIKLETTQSSNNRSVETYLLTPLFLKEVVQRV